MLRATYREDKIDASPVTQLANPHSLPSRNIPNNVITTLEHSSLAARILSYKSKAEAAKKKKELYKK